jgi:bifunctional oligoribonuclease and PAP phosphatase NrnA
MMSNQNNPVPLSEVAEMLRLSGHSLVMSHISPDGDAIGSLLGMGWLLRELGQDPTLVCSDPVPQEFQFLPGCSAVLTVAPPRLWDTVICLDASDPARLGSAYQPDSYGATPVIALDHHITNLRFASINWVDPSAAATAQIVGNVVDALEHPFSLNVATCLLTGLLTDTRGFRTSNVTYDVLNLATRLVGIGANIADLTQRTLNYKPFGIIRLWGPALTQARLDQGVVWTALTHEMRTSVGSPDGGEGGLVSFLLNAPEANVSAVFSEKGEHSVEVSLRSRPGWDVSGVAFGLGGGGHPQAAGCTLEGTLAQVVTQVLPLLQAVAGAGV